MQCMTYFGDVAQSDQLPFAAGKANQVIKLDYLNPFVAGMEAAYLDEAWFRVVLVAATGAAPGSGFRGEMVPQALQNINVLDLEGDRYVVEGASARILAQVFEGESYADEVDLANGVSVTIEHWLPMVVRPVSAYSDPTSCRWSLASLAKGKVTITWCPATLGPAAANQITITTTGSFVELWCVCVDEFLPVKKEKVRLEAHDYQINLSSDEYPTRDIRLLSGNWYFGDGNQNGGVAGGAIQPWPSQTITSKNFSWSQIQDTFFQAQYAKRRMMRTQDALGTVTVEDEALRARGLNIPLFSPRRDQRMTECPQIMDTWNIKTSLTFGSGNFTVANHPRLIVIGFVDRPGDKCVSHPSTVQQELLRPGPVVALNGQKIAPHDVAPSLVNKLPRLLVPIGSGPLTSAPKK